MMLTICWIRLSNETNCDIIPFPLRGKTMGFASIVKWVNGENLLTVDIDGTRYEYETSPFIKEKFQYMLRFNQGKAISYLKQNSELIRSYSLKK